jgi:hypothetical protein
MPIYKSTDGIAKINTTSTIFRGAEMVFGSGLFISASGGNITTDGDYKIHTFSTPGTSSFIIESIASPNNLNSVEYLIQGGGGSGAKQPGLLLVVVLEGVYKQEVLQFHQQPMRLL